MLQRSVWIRLTILFGASILLVLATRVPLMPRHLYSFDTVNLALALDDFDPIRHQPQPPGYPVFVAEAKIVHFFIKSPEQTFAVVKVLAGGFSVGLLFLLGESMFSAAAGAIAALLLFVNPVFWYSTLTSPLRPHLALVSILVGYFCWRSWSGESSCFYAASVALGLGGGLRPELSVLLLPLWAVTAWKTHKAGTMILGLLFFVAGTATWLGVLAVLYNGVRPMIISWLQYLYVQSESSSLLAGASELGWRRMAGRAFVWTGAGSLAWLWTLPFGWRKRLELPHWPRHVQFFLVWFLPLFLFQLFVHIGNPGHVLGAIPVVCLVGGFSVAAAERSLARRLKPSLSFGPLGRALHAGGLSLAIAVMGNLVLFFGRFPLPEPRPAGHFRGLASVTDAFRVGTYESSYVLIRWVEERTELGLNQIQRLKSSTDRPVLILWTRNGQPVWRKASFYLPQQSILELDEQGDPAIFSSMARLWSFNKVLAEYKGNPPFRIPVPKQARLIWLVGPNSAKRLTQVLPVESAPPIVYTDLPADAPSFRWGSFVFVPK